MSPKLSAAVENAYRVFARYPLKGTVSVCPCCVSDEIARKLSTEPLNCISPELLANYTHSAHSWDGKVEDDLRYLLPRYFELIAQERDPTHYGDEICLQRLSDADYRNTWREKDADAVDGFFLALLRDRLGKPVEVDWSGLPMPDDPTETALCLIAHAGGDIASLLAAWDADMSRNATLHIANVMAQANWSAKQLENTWWCVKHRPNAQAAMTEVVAWLLRPQIRARLEAACLAEEDEGAAALLSHAEDIVRGLI